MAWHAPIAAALLPLSLLGLLALTARVTAAGTLHAEVARKTLHVVMGLMALTFPWLLPEPGWFVAALTACLAALAALLQEMRHISTPTTSVVQVTLQKFIFVVMAIPLAVGVAV